MPLGPMASEAARGSGIMLRELRTDALALGAEEFADRHGAAFLLLSAAGLSLPRGAATTEVNLFDENERTSQSTANLTLVAYAVRRTGRSVGHLITAGRASNNDVTIPDLSISRFHAYLKEQDGARFVLQDAGSTNGTTVNGRAVPRQGHGPAAELKSGDTLRLGQVELTFLDAESLQAFVAKLAP